MNTEAMTKCDLCLDYEPQAKKIHTLDGKEINVCTQCINSVDGHELFTIFGDQMYYTGNYLDLKADTARRDLSGIINVILRKLNIQPSMEPQVISDTITIYKWGGDVIVWDEENKIEITKTSLHITGDAENLISNIRQLS